MTDTFPTQNGAVLRIIDDQYHLGFYQDGVWVDLGRAVMMWTLVEQDEASDE